MAAPKPSHAREEFQGTHANGEYFQQIPLTMQSTGPPKLVGPMEAPTFTETSLKPVTASM